MSATNWPIYVCLLGVTSRTTVSVTFRFVENLCLETFLEFYSDFLQFLLLKRTKFVNFANRRSDEGFGMKNNQWPEQISELMKSQFDDFVESITKGTIISDNLSPTTFE